MPNAEAAAAETRKRRRSERFAQLTEELRNMVDTFGLSYVVTLVGYVAAHHPAGEGESSTKGDWTGAAKVLADLAEKLINKPHPLGK